MSFYLGNSSDGLVDIHCFVCGKIIERTPYAGIFTAKCAECYRIDPVEESKPLEVLEAEGKIPKTTIGTMVSYLNETMDEVKEVIEAVQEVHKKRTAKKKSSGKSLGLKRKM
jgi:hypothetical protein